MPEIFLDFIGDASPWLVPLLVVLAVWGKFNWAALNNPDKKASFERAVGWLREDRFGQLYLGFLGGLMDRVGSWIGDRQRLSQASMAVSQSKGLTHRVFGFNPFTAKSYEKCLWLAFMYPVLAYLIAWAMGAEGQIGETNLFTNNNNALGVAQRWLSISAILAFMGVSLWFVLHWDGIKQWLALIGILLLMAYISSWFGTTKTTTELFVIFQTIYLFIFILLYLGGLLTGLLIYHSARHAHEQIYHLAVAVAIAVTFANAGSITFASAVTFTGAVTFAFVGAVAIAGAVAISVAAAITTAIVIVIVGVVTDIGVVTITIAVFVAGIMITAMQSLQTRADSKQSIHWFWLKYSLLLMSLGVSSLSRIAESGFMLFILLWLLLPLVNAPLDWLSLGFTRGLLQAVRTGNHSGWRTLIWAAADLLLAFIFLFLITAVLVGVTALGNAIAGKTLVDIGCILSNLKTNASHPDHWWIYFMLLSTLIPTLFHFALAGGAATLWLPRKWRTQLADGLEEDTHKTFGTWAYLTFTPVIGFILMPLGLLWSLWWLLNVNGGALGTLLLSWAEGLAKWADPSMALVCGAGG